MVGRFLMSSYLLVHKTEDISKTSENLLIFSRNHKTTFSENKQADTTRTTTDNYNNNSKLQNKIQASNIKKVHRKQTKKK